LRGGEKGKFIPVSKPHDVNKYKTRTAVPRILNSCDRWRWFISFAFWLLYSHNIVSVIAENLVFPYSVQTSSGAHAASYSDVLVIGCSFPESKAASMSV
jgi:hypothetical protein